MILMLRIPSNSGQNQAQQQEQNLSNRMHVAHISTKRMPHHIIRDLKLERTGKPTFGSYPIIFFSFNDAVASGKADSAV